MTKTRRKKTPAADDSQEDLSRIERPLTLIAQVEQALRKSIKSAAFPGGKLPTEVELAEKLGVSRETVRRATETLQQEGLLVKYRRKGTFIRIPDEPRSLDLIPSTIFGYIQADYTAGQAESDVITRATSSFIFDGALVEAGLAGYELVVRSATPRLMREAFEHMHATYRLRGVIFASVAEEKLLRRLSGLDVPTVVLDHDVHVPHVSSILGDSQQSGVLAVQHLAELGHRRIAYAHWHQADLNPWRPRGYRQGLQEAGLPRRRAWEFHVPLNKTGAVQVVDQLLNLSPRPSAVFTFNNTLAGYVIDEAARRGLSVPEHLSVVGGGGEAIVGLTCTQIDWYDLGREAMRMLIRGVDAGAGHKPEFQQVPFTLHEGTTTGPPPSTK